jgi:hypothetical protein
MKEEGLRDANAHEDLSHGAPSAPPASMVERVAAAMSAWMTPPTGPHCLENYPGQAEHYRAEARKNARAAIAALRDPTREMLDGAVSHAIWRYLDADEPDFVEPSARVVAAECWQTMIDEALK